MELFKKMGPRVILIEYRGRLTGLVTVKDCLKYQFKVEAQEHPQSVGSLDARQEKLWGVIRTAAGWVDGGLNSLKRRLGFGGSAQGVRLESPILARGEGRERDRFVVGDEDAEVELEDRGRPGSR